MKVAFVLPKLSGGGAEYVALEWAKYLTAAGNEVTFCLTSGISQNELPNSIRSMRVKGRSIFSRVANLRKFLKSSDVDVVIGLMPFWNLLAIFASFSLAPNRPSVLISSHTIESAYGAKRGRGFFLQTSLAKIVYRFADGLLASSHPVAAEAIARYGISREKLWVVPNPVFPQKVSLSGSAPRTNPSVQLTLIIPGRIVDQKRPSLAVDIAVEIRNQTGFSPNLIFVGEGAAIESTRQRSLEAGVSASFVPWTSSWAGLAGSNSVVLLPSMLEGFGNVVLDAAAAHLPVVASSRALGVADALIPGVTGVLVAGDDAVDYAEGIAGLREFIADPGATEKWMQRFTSENSGRILIKILKRLQKD